jgi:DNA invertase Pin-like site-specific DNA recombinase
MKVVYTQFFRLRLHKQARKIAILEQNQLSKSLFIVFYSLFIFCLLGIFAQREREREREREIARAERRKIVKGYPIYNDKAHKK